MDNVLFYKNPKNLVSEGKMLKIPTVIGLGRHEGAFYYPCKEIVANLLFRYTFVDNSCKVCMWKAFLTMTA